MDELAPAKNDTVPLTPEILNSVMAMTNPLEYSMAAMNNSKLQVIYYCCWSYISNSWNACNSMASTRNQNLPRTMCAFELFEG